MFHISVRGSNTNSLPQISSLSTKLYKERKALESHCWPRWHSFGGVGTETHWQGLKRGGAAYRGRTTKPFLQEAWLCFREKSAARRGFRAKGGVFWFVLRWERFKENQRTQEKCQSERDKGREEAQVNRLELYERSGIINGARKSDGRVWRRSSPLNQRCSPGVDPCSGWAQVHMGTECLLCEWRHEVALQCKLMVKEGDKMSIWSKNTVRNRKDKWQVEVLTKGCK